MKNIFTGIEYEAIKYDKYLQSETQKIDKFIIGNLNVRLRITMPDIYVFGLEHVDYETIIKPSNYILRRLDRKDVFKVVTKEIIKSNFEILSYNN